MITALALATAATFGVVPARAQTLVGQREDAANGHPTRRLDSGIQRRLNGIEAEAGAGRLHTVSSSTWRFELTPFLWASGVDGDVGVRGRTAHVDVSFRELIKHLDGAFMLAGLATRGAWGVGFDIMYVGLSDRRATPGPLFTDAEFGTRQLILELTGRYRVLPPDPVAVDLLAGGRYFHLRNTLDLTEGDLPPIELSDTEGWFDPIVGLGASLDARRRWHAQARADIGGFNVGSDLTWQLIGIVGYRFSDLIAVKAGYRYLDIDYSSDGFTFDVAMAGFITGVTFSF